MINEKLENELNAQINRELFSEYLYLSIAMYCSSMNFPGMENFFVVQGQEEHFHAMKIINYLNSRRGRVILKAIDEPRVDFNSIEEAFTAALQHEEFITKSINNLMDLAIKENDHSARTFLQWYVTEQDEEEETFDSLVNRLKLVSNNGQALLMLDKELGARKFTPPVEE